MEYPKGSQYRHAKSRCRVQSWARYEAGLRRRGDLTVWLCDEVLDAWRAPPTGKPGGQQRYADIAIEAALTIRMVFHLAGQRVEVQLGCGILNRMARLGMPDSYRVA